MRKKAAILQQKLPHNLADLHSKPLDTLPLLDAAAISHSYEYPLFEDVHLTLNKQESIAVVGVSGSGKSTLLHILSTFLKPKSGIVKLFGKDIYSLDEREVLDIRRFRIGIIFQSHYLFKGLSAKENLEISSIISKRDQDKQLIKKFKIDTVLEQHITELSGGQQQRVSIARVLAKKPKIIFADEPTGNLDKKTADDVMDTIFEYLQDSDAAMFLVTHDLELAKKCDRVYELRDGRLETR